MRNFLRRQRGRVTQATNVGFCDEGTKDDSCRLVARFHMCAAMEAGMRSAREALKLIVVCVCVVEKRISPAMCAYPTPTRRSEAEPR